MINGIIMFSGGLDSVCAAHLLLSQGLSLQGLHFVLPFQAGLGLPFTHVRAAAEKLRLPLRIVEEGEEFLDVVKDPRFGFGKNANPCVDCRIHRLGKAKKIMEELGASFIATGEVVGQRPMSQRRDCLYKIEKSADLKGRLIRPLSAKLLNPTIPECDGTIDRSLLLGIGGRGRGEQIAYAKRFGLVHGTPAGGCFLAEKVAATRLQDLRAHVPAFFLEDFRLLAFGRHFRLNPHCKLVVGRDDADNVALEQIASADDAVLRLADDLPGPLMVLRGSFDRDLIRLAAGILLRYSKYRNGERCDVMIRIGGKEERIPAVAHSEEECEKYRIRVSADRLS